MKKLVLLLLVIAVSYTHLTATTPIYSDKADKNIKRRL